MLFVLLIVSACMHTAKSINTDTEQCTVQRYELFACAQTYGDVDGNKHISIHEVTYFRNHALRWYEKALVWFARETPEKVMTRCTVASDVHHITEASFNATTKTCLKHCKDWLLFEKMCKRMENMSRQERIAYFGGYQHWRHSQ